MPLYRVTVKTLGFCLFGGDKTVTNIQEHESMQAVVREFEAEKKTVSFPVFLENIELLDEQPPHPNATKEEQ